MKRRFLSLGLTTVAILAVPHHAVAQVCDNQFQTAPCVTIQDEDNVNYPALSIVNGSASPPDFGPDGIDVLVSTTSGTAYGVYAQVASTSGTGVFGQATATSGTTYGVYGTASSGVGVYGLTTAWNHSGVTGNNTSTVTGQNDAGVSGYSTNGYGGYFVTTNGTYSAFFNKDIYVNGGSLGPSDIRFKKNVRPVEGAIDQLLKLKGVNFEWKEPEKHDGMTGVQTGFIAQDVEKVFPEWVRTDKDGFKALTVAQIEGLEVESIRTLKAENDDLKRRMKVLEEMHQPTLRASMAVTGAGTAIGGLAIAAAILASGLRRKRETERQAPST